MKIAIVGTGSFGCFLNKVLSEGPFTLVSPEESAVIILAVPISAYDELGAKYKDKLLANVCSVQMPSTEILLKHTKKVTGLHPLFGARTPPSERHTILTHCCGCIEEDVFIAQFRSATGAEYTKMEASAHDIMMNRTHVPALSVALSLVPIIAAAAYIPDHLVPNSFKLLRKFVKTMEDMPAGTVESILANPYSEANIQKAGLLLQTPESKETIMTENKAQDPVEPAVPSKVYEDPSQRELPRYKCHKEVWALQIKAIISPRTPLPGEEYDASSVIVPYEKGYSTFRVSPAYIEKHKPEAGGYYVVYADGYKSYSPFGAFRDGYELIS